MQRVARVRQRQLSYTCLFLAGNHIPGTAEATFAKFCLQVEYVKC